MYEDHAELLNYIGNDSVVDVSSQMNRLPLTVIREHAFYHCAMTTLTLLEGITELKEGAFANCSALTEVSFPESLTVIEDSIFMATALDIISIPANVQTIGEWALPSSLTLPSIHLTDTEIVVSSIPTLPQSCMIYAPADSKAEAFTKQWGFTFFPQNDDPISPPSGLIAGDVTGDYALGIDDVVMLYKYLHHSDALTFPGNGDINGDSLINVSDLALQKKMLLRTNSDDPEPVPNLQTVSLTKDVTAEDVEDNAADDAFVLAQTAFAVTLLQKTADQDNTLISPYSVMQALAMTANGAREQTLTNMETTLGTPIDALNAYLYTQRTSQPDTEECKLSTANSIWMRDDENLHVDPEFLQINANYYGADAFKSPFDASTVKGCQQLGKGEY